MAPEHNHQGARLDASRLTCRLDQQGRSFHKISRPNDASSDGKAPSSLINPRSMKLSISDFDNIFQWIERQNISVMLL